VVPLLASLGAVLGALTAWPAFRLSVEFGHPPSAACASCSTTFSSWVRLNRRCGSCHGVLSVSPLWTALAGGVAWGLLGWAVPMSFFLGACLVLAAAGVLLAVIDLAVLRLPDPIVLACLVSTLVLLALQAWTDNGWRLLVRALLGGIVCFAAYLIFGLLPGAPMGLGDIKLAGVLGLTLGYLGWPAVIAGLILPFLINGPFAVVALVRRGRKAAAPFGPALLTGWLSTALLLSLSILYRR
jgi:leader peptidase (prepilin peptidase) / N-methyltransferase